MNFPEAEKKLREINQQHLLKYWSELSPDQQKNLLQQIEMLNLNTFQHQRQLLIADPSDASHLEAFDDYYFRGNLEHKNFGRQLVKQGKVGCLLVAGGQGTRLRIQGPKGTFPVTPLTHKSLFQLFSEKVIAAGKQAGKRLSLAIMTSPQNHQETVRFFEKYQLFGLENDQVDFFTQGELPLLNREGNLFLEEKGKIAQGADGNGFALREFFISGIWNKWQTQGIQFLNFVLVDNPLADPFDAELIGFHAANGLEVTVKCTPKTNPNEKVGLLVKKNGKVAVVEYSEISQEELFATDARGGLKHCCANLSLFCFSLDFIKKVHQKQMPLHRALKAAKWLNDLEETVYSETPSFWKFERFIFDLLEDSQKVKALLYPREECFAPLKNFTGPDSIADVQLALLNEAKRVVEQRTGLPAPTEPFELPQEFYYPTPDA